jgi:hypothetical protein
MQLLIPSIPHAFSSPTCSWLINNKHLFLTLPEAGKPKIKEPADLGSDEGLLLVHMATFLPPVSSQGRKDKTALSEAFLIRTLIPFMRDPSL